MAAVAVALDYVQMRVAAFVREHALVIFRVEADDFHFGVFQGNFFALSL